MEISEQGINLLKKLEGMVPFAYLCPAGRLTIGIGHLMTAEDFSYLPPKRANAQICLLTDHIKQNEKQLKKGIIEKNGKKVSFNVKTSSITYILTNITVREAEDLLVQDLKKYVNAVNRVFSKTTLNQNQFDALVCLTYNIGTPSLAKSMLARKINSGTFEIEKEWNKWNKITNSERRKVVSDILTDRRKKEWALFSKG